MPVGAIIGAVSGIGSALIGAHSASSAASAQEQAAQLASQTQLQMYNQTRQDLMPWMTTGGAANSQLANIYGLNPGQNGIPNTQALTTALTNFPGYQFGLQQGQTALDQSAASRGMLLSGNQLAASQQYGQGYAMANAWQPYLSGLQSISTGGQNSAAKVGELGNSAAGNAGSAQLAYGSAATAGATNTGLALQSALNNSLYAFEKSGLGGGGGQNWGNYVSGPNYGSGYDSGYSNGPPPASLSGYLSGLGN